MLLPFQLHSLLRESIKQTTFFLRGLRLAYLHSSLTRKPPGSLVRLKGYRFHITDGGSFYCQYKNIFLHRIYHFTTRQPTPFIIDGGSSMGVSVCYFKHVYPRARILAFEPDPAIYQILQKNISSNRLRGIDPINAGLGPKPAVLPFDRNGGDGGRFKNVPGALPVRSLCLSNFLNKKIDFLKLNIEGMELPVLQEAADSGKLKNVREIVIEYHGWSREEQNLAAILQLLNTNGFRYMIHDFDAETSSESKPPFFWTADTSWFCLIYAKNPC